MKLHGFAVLLPLLAGCTGPSTAQQSGAPEGIAHASASAAFDGCVALSEIKGIEPLDDHHLILLADGKRSAYLVAVTGGSFNLEMQTGFSPRDADRDGRICANTRDTFVYRRLNGVYNCRITGIEKLDDRRRAELGITPRP